LPSPAKAFKGAIEATPVTGKYKLGLVLTAFGMVLLMAAYFGLIFLLGYAIYYDLAHFSQLLDAADKSHSYYAPFGCLVAPFCGVVVIFFMVKPFLAARPPEPDRYTLTRESDPELFAVIAKTCELVKAPLPSRVDVDCQANASVRFRNGWRSLGDNDVMLTIGLPLVASLTMQEFVGVLAHEFGHFRQGAGMRVTYIIRSISRWFAYVVYQRDQWDIWLARAACKIDVRIGIFLHLTRFCIWMSRRILWVMMHVGNIISGFMLRQMEFDADSYETKVAGSAAFAQTTAKLRVLNAASLWAHGKMKESWRNRRLPDDVVGFIGASIKNIPPDLQKKIDEETTKDKTGIFDTHPCDAARVRASAAMNRPGVFHLTEPASRLFNGFEALCKGTTRFHYESTLELRVKDENLVPLEKSERDSQSLAEGEAALREFFGGLKFKYRPILISDDELASASENELMQQVTLARQAMKESAPIVLKANREYEEAEALYQRGLAALKSGSQTATEKATTAMNALVPTLEAYESHAQTRLVGAMLLLHHPGIAAKLPEIEALRNEADQLTIVFRVIGQVFPVLQELRRKNEAMMDALRACQEQSLAAAARVRVAELEPELRQILAGLKPRLEQVRYPYNDTRDDITLAKFARADIPANKVEGLCNKCACHVNGLLPLYARVLGRLAFIALKVEEKIPVASTL
jgi:Zn-dependent protease with chaperone function